MTDWWSGETGGWIGAIGGSAFGIAGGILGLLVSRVARRGRAKRLVVGFHVTVTGVAVVALAAGIVALAVGQPYAVYYPLLLLGGIGSVVIGMLLPVTLRAYREAEARHLAAEEIRRGA